MILPRLFHSSLLSLLVLCFGFNGYHSELRILIDLPFKVAVNVNGLSSPMKRHSSLHGIFSSVIELESQHSFGSFLQCRFSIVAWPILFLYQIPILVSCGCSLSGLWFSLQWLFLVACHTPIAIMQRNPESKTNK